MSYATEGADTYAWACAVASVPQRSCADSDNFICTSSNKSPKLTRFSLACLRICDASCNNLPKIRDLEVRLSEELDAIDRRILELLQGDASLSIAEVAEKVGLSSSPAWRRIERLKKEKIIKGQVTLLDYEKLGLRFEVYASVKLQLPSRENLERFESAVADWPEVVECATVTGAADYMLRVIARDIHAYDDFLRDKMLAIGVVSDVQSHIVMR